MTAGRISLKSKTRRPVAKKTAADTVPGWYSTREIPAEQQAAVARILERRGALDLADMLGVQTSQAVAA